MSGLQQRFRSGDASCGDYVVIVSRMLFDEPCVAACVRLLQTNCLRHGIVLRWGDHTPPTPSFAAHLREYWEPFCRDALLSFLAVGFAPYRIRRSGRTLVPEVLPLGTFTWRIATADGGRKRPRADMNSGYNNSDGIPEQPVDSQPLLRYEVRCTSCDDTIHVFAYARPHATLSCYSAMASLIPQYVSLLHQRERAVRAEEWNCKPNFILQDTQKTLINETAEKGGPIAHGMENELYGMSFDGGMREQGRKLEMMEEHRARANFPEQGSVLIAPKNSTAHSLDKADAPLEMHRRELMFARTAAIALGVPPPFALQASQAVGSSGLGTGGSAWQESQEVLSRGLCDTCAELNRALERLLAVVYRHIYSDPPSGDPAAAARRLPTFALPVTPLLPLEHLLPIFDAQLLSDEAYSRLFQMLLGAPLDKEVSLKARTERHRANTILPFKDKKDAPK